MKNKALWLASAIITCVRRGSATDLGKKYAQRGHDLRKDAQRRQCCI